MILLNGREKSIGGGPFFEDFVFFFLLPPFLCFYFWALLSPKLITFLSQQQEQR